jgi:Tfp pilus assembly protein PilE
MKYSRGFTLLELVVFVGAIIILLVVVYFMNHG